MKKKKSFRNINAAVAAVAITNNWAIKVERKKWTVTAGLCFDEFKIKWKSFLIKYFN
jgi:hypothetical protein